MSDVDETLNSLDALFALGQQALDTPRTVRASIASAVTRALDAQIDVALRAIPVESLKDALPKGTRMGGLAQSRFRTVADVANSSAATLGTGAWHRAPICVGYPHRSTRTTEAGAFADTIPVEPG